MKTASHRLTTRDSIIRPEQNEQYYMESKRSALSSLLGFFIIFGLVGNAVVTLIYETLNDHFAWSFPLLGFLAVLVMVILAYPFVLRSEFKYRIRKYSKPATVRQNNKILRLTKHDTVFKPVLLNFIASKGDEVLTYGDYRYLLSLEEKMCAQAKLCSIQNKVKSIAKD